MEELMEDSVPFSLLSTLAAWEVSCQFGPYMLPRFKFKFQEHNRQPLKLYDHSFIVDLNRARSLTVPTTILGLSTSFSMD